MVEKYAAKGWLWNARKERIILVAVVVGVVETRGRAAVIVTAAAARVPVATRLIGGARTATVNMVHPFAPSGKFASRICRHESVGRI